MNKFKQKAVNILQRAGWYPINHNMVNDYCKGIINITEGCLFEKQGDIRLVSEIMSCYRKTDWQAMGWLLKEKARKHISYIRNRAFRPLSQIR